MISSFRSSARNVLHALRRHNPISQPECRYLRGGRIVPSKLPPASAVDASESEIISDSFGRGPKLSDYSIDDVWRDPRKDRTPPRSNAISAEFERPRRLETPFSKVGTPAERARPMPGIIDHDAEPDEPTDLLMERIRSAHGGEDLLETVKRYEKIMNYEHLLLVVQSLTEVLRRDKDLKRAQLLGDDRFVTLCTRLIRSHRYVKHDGVVSVLKFLSYSGVPNKARVMQTYLHLLRETLNDLSLSDMMFCSQILSRMTDNQLAGALNIALPIAFELRFEKEMDVDNVKQLIRILGYAVQHKLRSQTLNTILDAFRRLMRKEELWKNISPKEVGTLFISLERGNFRNEELESFVIEQLCRRKQADFHPVFAGALLRSVRYQRGKYPYEYHPEHKIHALEKRLLELVPPEEKRTGLSEGMEEFPDSPRWDDNPLK